MSGDRLPDLHVYIDRVIDSGVTDVADVAVKVFGTTPAEVVEAHVLHFLRLAVRDRMAERRARNPIIRGLTGLTRQPAGRPVAALPSTGTKRARQRDQFAMDRVRWLSDTVWTGERRVTLGEATVLDLRGAAEAMRAQASRSVATAVRYEEIAAVVAESGVSTVGDLPEDRLRALMDRQ